MVKEGFMTVWEKMHQKENLNVVLNCHVTSIDRQENKIVVDCLLEGEQKLLEFDYIIPTIPLKKFIRVLKNPSEKEQNIFSKLHKYRICATLYESDHQYQNTQVIEYRPDLMNVKVPGAVYAQRHSERCVRTEKKKEPKIEIREKSDEKKEKTQRTLGMSDGNYRTEKSEFGGNKRIKGERGERLKDSRRKVKSDNKKADKSRNVDKQRAPAKVERSYTYTDGTVEKKKGTENVRRKGVDSPLKRKEESTEKMEKRPIPARRMEKQTSEKMEKRKEKEVTPEKMEKRNEEPPQRVRKAEKEKDETPEKMEKRNEETPRTVTKSEKEKTEKKEADRVDSPPLKRKGSVKPVKRKDIAEKTEKEKEKTSEKKEKRKEETPEKVKKETLENRKQETPTAGKAKDDKTTKQKGTDTMTEKREEETPEKREKRKEDTPEKREKRKEDTTAKRTYTMTEKREDETPPERKEKRKEETLEKREDTSVKPEKKKEADRADSPPLKRKGSVKPVKKKDIAEKTEKGKEDTSEKRKEDTPENREDTSVKTEKKKQTEWTAHR